MKKEEEEVKKLEAELERELKEQEKVSRQSRHMGGWGVRSGGGRPSPSQLQQERLPQQQPQQPQRPVRPQRDVPATPVVDIAIEGYLQKKGKYFQIIYFLFSNQFLFPSFPKKVIWAQWRHGRRGGSVLRRIGYSTMRIKRMMVPRKTRKDSYHWWMWTRSSRQREARRAPSSWTPSRGYTTFKPRRRKSRPIGSKTWRRWSNPSRSHELSTRIQLSMKTSSLVPSFGIATLRYDWPSLFLLMIFNWKHLEERRLSYRKAYP